MQTTTILIAPAFVAAWLLWQWHRSTWASVSRRKAREALRRGDPFVTYLHVSGHPDRYTPEQIKAAEARWLKHEERKAQRCQPLH